MTRRLATIDLGTNTVRLLVADVADGDWRIVAQDQVVTRLGEGMAARGTLGAEAMARTQTAVAAYVERAQRLSAAQVRIVATSAMREAANGAAFARFLETTTGRAVHIISGEEEARLTLAGVRQALALRGSLLLFDIGGGSTEYIYAEGPAVRAAVSLPLGVVPLAERFPFPAAVDWPRYDRMRAEVDARLRADLGELLAAARAARLVGTAGTVTALAALDLGLSQYDAGRVHGHVLSPEAVRRLRDRLGALDLSGRAGLPCLEPGRADLMMAGIAIVEATLALTEAREMLVSDAGLREGILVDAVASAGLTPSGPPTMLNEQDG